MRRLICILLAAILCAGKAYSQDLIPFVNKDKWGYCDKNKKIIIPCKYDEATPFKDGMAVVGIGKYYGIINSEGTAVTAIKYIHTGRISEGMVACQADNEKWGYVNKEGKETVPCIYDDALTSSNFRCREGVCRVYKNLRDGLVDTQGKTVAECKYYNISDFEGGVCIGETENGFYLIDKAGNETKLKYDLVKGFREGLAAVKKGKKCGFIDRTGREVIPCMYTDVTSFSEGLARVNLKGSCFFINRENQKVFDFLYDDCERIWFTNLLLDNPSIDPGFEDGMLVVARNKKYGAIDITGKEVIPCKYYFINGNFRSGIVGAKDTQNGDYILLDKNGTQVSSIPYSSITDYDCTDGVIEVYRDATPEISNDYNWLKGYIDARGVEYFNFGDESAYLKSDEKKYADEKKARDAAAKPEDNKPEVKKDIPYEFKSDYFTAGFPAYYKSDVIYEAYGSKQVISCSSGDKLYIIDFTRFNETYIEQLKGKDYNLANMKREVLMQVMKGKVTAINSDGCLSIHPCHYYDFTTEDGQYGKAVDYLDDNKVFTLFILQPGKYPSNDDFSWFIVNFWIK